MGAESRLSIIFDDRCNQCPNIRVPHRALQTDCPLINYQRVADPNSQLHTQVQRALDCGFVEEISWAPDEVNSRTLVCKKSENGGGYVTIVDNTI